jgi:putative membrane protein
MARRLRDANHDTAVDAPAARPADPDSRARTHLANERTFLAWLRTGITLVALGIASAEFLDSGTAQASPLVDVLALALIGGGIALVIAGRRRFLASRALIEQGRPGLDTRAITLATAFLIVVGVLAAAFVLLLEMG